MLRRKLRVEGQDARRRRTVARQASRRRETVLLARLARSTEQGDVAVQHGQDDAVTESNVEMSNSGKTDVDENVSSRKWRRMKQVGKERLQEEEAYYAAQFQVPEWMLEVPSDLGEEKWAVVAKPEGPRCLVVAAKGRTFSRKKNGRILHSFHSVLPNGSRETNQSSKELTILECVFHEANETYYVLDMLWWKGFPLVDSEFSFRQFWVQSKLAEIPNIFHVSSLNRYRFQAVTMQPCSVQGLEIAYRGRCEYAKDGLLFYLKESQYEEGLSPCVIAWKDAMVSRYPIDSPDGINPYPIQTCVLKVGRDRNGYAVGRALGEDIVAFLDNSELERHNVKVGDMARFEVAPGSISVSHEDPMLNDVAEEGSVDTANVWMSNLKLHAKCKTRMQPDSSCKIAYQHSMRYAPLRIEEIVQALNPSLVS